jgi:hypothetical protein
LRNDKIKDGRDCGEVPRYLHLENGEK